MKITSLSIGWVTHRCCIARDEIGLNPRRFFFFFFIWWLQQVLFLFLFFFFFFNCGLRLFVFYFIFICLIAVENMGFVRLPDFLLFFFSASQATVIIIIIIIIISIIYIWNNQIRSAALDLSCAWRDGHVALSAEESASHLNQWGKLQSIIVHSVVC